MNVKYKIVKQSQPGVKGGGTYCYCARACNRGHKNPDDISKILSQRTTLSAADIYVVIVGLTDLMPELLLQNNTVELGMLGTLSLSLKSRQEELPEKVHQVQ